MNVCSTRGCYTRGLDETPAPQVPIRPPMQAGSCFIDS